MRNISFMVRFNREFNDGLIIKFRWIVNRFISVDLDDSQPDNGAHSAGDMEISESDSELSAKEDYVDEEPLETKYVPNVEEEFGNVSVILDLSDRN